MSKSASELLHDFPKTLESIDQRVYLIRRANSRAAAKFDRSAGEESQDDDLAAECLPLIVDRIDDLIRTLQQFKETVEDAIDTAKYES